MTRVLIANEPDLEKPLLDVALSERNLLVLTSKLYTPGSKQLLLSYDVPSEYDHARIRAEHDAYHYASPTREGVPPGPMHPVAEAVRVLVKAALDDIDFASGEAQS